MMTNICPYNGNRLRKSSQAGFGAFHCWKCLANSMETVHVGILLLLQSDSHGVNFRHGAVCG